MESSKANEQIKIPLGDQGIKRKETEKSEEIEGKQETKENVNPEKKVLYPIIFGKRKSFQEEREKMILINNWTESIQSDEWKELMSEEFKKEYFYSILQKLERILNSKTIIYPPKNRIFEAFNLCPLSKLKCIIIGQDPYHGENQAHGLSFSVKRNVDIPPSLNNIFKELYSDLGIEIPSHGCLESWAKQGILLLNATLTVEAGKANSHKDFGWQIFTSSILKILNQKKQNLVFILWGKFAQSMSHIIDTKKHCIIAAAHPSPFSEKLFFGCKVFSKANHYLKSKSIEQIDWSIPN